MVVRKVIAACPLRVAEPLRDRRTEREKRIAIFTLTVNEREGVAKLEVPIGAVVAINVPFEGERRLDLEIGKRDLERHKLRVVARLPRAAAHRPRMVLVGVAKRKLDRSGQKIKVVRTE